MSKDLGTYYVRVVFHDDTGFYYKINTGARYVGGGRDAWSPLNASRLEPHWESEEDLIHSTEFMWNEGNYSCDCNKQLFLAYAKNENKEEEECGQTLKLKSLTLIKPDGSEQELEIY